MTYYGSASPASFSSSGKGRLELPAGNSITYEKLLHDTAHYWGVDPSLFSNGSNEVQDCAMSCFSNAYGDKRARPDWGLTYAYIWSIDETTATMCAFGKWTLDGLPDPFQDISVKVITKNGSRIEMFSETGRRLELHARYDFRPDVISLEYYQGELPEDRWTINVRDAQHGSFTVHLDSVQGFTSHPPESRRMDQGGIIQTAT